MSIYQPVPDIDYMENDQLYGNYQYVTLEQIVTDYMMGMNQDDYVAGTPRFKVLYQARKGVREFYYDIVREVKAIELELSPILTIPVPPDFVNLVRVSWVDEQGLLHPLATDSRMSLATAWLQDHTFELLYDDQGRILQGSGVRDYVGNISKKYSFCREQQFQPNVPLHTQFNNGKYKLDKVNGILQFGSEVNGKNIVLEYISDGLYTGAEGRPEAELRIHKFAEKALHDFISYELIKNRRNVPGYAVQLARKECYNSRRMAKARLNGMTKDDLLQVFRGSARWVKS